jgi:hypothetical protein
LSLSAPFLSSHTYCSRGWSCPSTTFSSCEWRMPREMNHLLTWIPHLGAFCLQRFQLLVSECSKGSSRM